MTAFRVRGVIEGFYGRPWSWEERERLVPFLAEHGLNAYAYAPKNDPLHRDRWREPYLPEDWDRFSHLAGRCAAAGVDFVFGVSPLGFRFTRDDRALLVAKLEAADAAGIRSFCLLVDDMPQRGSGGEFGTPAAADVALVGEVHQALGRLGPDRRLWFVPQPYSGDADTAYLRELGEGVPPSVDICWTGSQVCSADVTLEHAREVEASLRRPFLLWDNHPVNDGGMRHDPHLGPLRGRDPRLPDAAAGIVANLALQPEASRIAVATVGDYAADPVAYDPGASWRRALVAVTGSPADAEAVAALADLACRSPLEPGRRLDNALTPELARFWRRWRDGDDRRAAIEEISEALAVLAGHADRLTTALTNGELRDDLLPWSRKLAREVAGARVAVDVLRRSLDAPQDPGVPALRRQALDTLEPARMTAQWVAGNQLEEFARACLQAGDALTAQPTAVAGDAPPEA
jgi:hyaluronoglucosaminidase